MKPIGIPRWRTIDPLADLDVWSSPYVYMNNNPVRNIDPNGEHWYSIEEEDEDGNVVTKYYHETRQLTKQQMKDKGYTAYMGRNMELDGVYYSITGEKYDMNREVTRDIKRADDFVIFWENLSPQEQKMIKDILKQGIGKMGDLVSVIKEIYPDNNGIRSTSRILSGAIAFYNITNNISNISENGSNLADWLDIVGSAVSLNIYGSIANNYYQFSKTAAKSINNFNNHYTPKTVFKSFSDYFTW